MVDHVTVDGDCACPFGGKVRPFRGLRLTELSTDGAMMTRGEHFALRLCVYVEHMIPAYLEPAQKDIPSPSRRKKRSRLSTSPLPTSRFPLSRGIYHECQPCISIVRDMDEVTCFLSASLAFLFV